MNRFLLGLFAFFAGMLVFASSLTAMSQTWCVALVPQFFDSKYNPITIRWDTEFNSGGSWDAAVTSGASGVMQSERTLRTTANEVCVRMPLWFFDSFTATTTINIYNNQTNQKLGYLTLTTSTQSIFGHSQNLTASSMGMTNNGWGTQNICFGTCTVAQFPWP